MISRTLWTRVTFHSITLPPLLKESEIIDNLQLSRTFAWTWLKRETSTIYNHEHFDYALFQTSLYP